MKTVPWAKGARLVIPRFTVSKDGMQHCADGMQPISDWYSCVNTSARYGVCHRWDKVNLRYISGHCVVDFILDFEIRQKEVRIGSPRLVTEVVYLHDYIRVFGTHTELRAVLLMDYDNPPWSA